MNKIQDEFLKAFNGTPREFSDFSKGFPPFQRSVLNMIYAYMFIQRERVGGKNE